MRERVRRNEFLLLLLPLTGHLKYRPKSTVTAEKHSLINMSEQQVSPLSFFPQFAVIQFPFDTDLGSILLPA